MHKSLAPSSFSRCRESVAYLIYGPKSRARFQCATLLPPPSSVAHCLHTLLTVGDKVKQHKKKKTNFCTLQLRMHFPWNVNRSYLVKCARRPRAASLNRRGVACKQEEEKKEKAHAAGCFEVNVQLQRVRERQHLLRLNVQLEAAAAQ